MSTPFEESYAGQLRALVGHRLLKLPGACVVIENEDGTILLERSVGRTHWRLVGGLAEETESLQNCAIREVYEETGLRLRQLEVFGFADDPRHTRALGNQDIVYPLTLLFWSRSFHGELRSQPGEIEELGWWHPERLPENTNESTRRFVQAYQRFQESACFQLITDEVLWTP